MIALGGCGAVTGTSPDAALANAPTDAAPRCNPNAAFGPPHRIDELDTAAEEDLASLTPDELTMYFSSTRVGAVGSYDIFSATRADRDAAWGNVQVVGGVNTVASERAPMISADQRTLYARTGIAPDYQIGVSTRTTASGLFNGLTDAPLINASGANDEGGILLDNAIYFASDRSGNYQIMRAARTGTTLGPPLVVSGDMLDLASSEGQPVVTPDELNLYFESDRAGGTGADDIYVAKRQNLADGFSAPVNLAGLNTASADFPTWVSADNCVLYFTNRNAGDYDLLFAARGQ